MSILRYLNRPSQKKEQDKQAELSKRKQGPVVVRNIKWFMFVFFNAVALVFDGLAVTTVYTLTNGNYLLSALALLPTGIPMFMWEGGWLYALASPEQKRRSIYGVILSVASAIVVGVLAILANLGDAEMRFWVSTGLLSWCVITVVVHGIWAAQYFYKDPVIVRDHELQVAISDNEYQAESLDEAEKILDKAVTLLEKEEKMRKRFGEAEVNRALEILLGVDLNGDGTIGGKLNKGSNTSNSTNSTGGDAPKKPDTTFTLQDYLDKAGMSKEQAVIKFGGLRYEDFAGDCNPRFEHISSGNMKKIWFEELKAGNPTPAAVTGRNS